MIKDIQAIQILDSRGNPTIRSFITLDDNSVHTASVPSGASTGSREAHELRDDNLPVYGGKGVLKAVTNVNTIIKGALVGKTLDLKELDEILLSLDATENKNKLGANAILSVSMAAARAQAHVQNQPLWKFLNEYYFRDFKPAFPKLMVNIINGGIHANWNLDIQEFMIVPNPTTPTESVKIASEIFHALGKLLKDKNMLSLVGDEGGYSPMLSSNEEAFKVILEAAKNAHYENVVDFRFAIDSAASEFYLIEKAANSNYKNGKYIFNKDHKEFSSEELITYYAEIGQKYKILSFEDAFAEQDFTAHKNFTDMAKRFEFTAIGDDLFCTNPTIIEQGINEKWANGVLVKLNQIGTVTETAAAINLAKKANWKVAISHRSGETEDNFIADLSYSCAADFLKAGSMSRSERLSKYNRLLEIECGL